jgi:signal transduction histidine kinase
MTGLVRLWERLTGLDRRAVDWTIAVVLTVVTQIELSGTGPAGHAALLLTVAVAFRRDAPLAVAGLAGLAIAVQGLADNPPSVFGEYAAVTLAIYTVAAESELRTAILGGLLIVAGIVLHDIPSKEYGTASGMASDLMTPAIFWVVGRAVRVNRHRTQTARSHAQRLAEEQEETARRAVEMERRHIARELHDVVTHSLGVVVLQAQAAQRLLDGQNPVVAGALTNIEGSGRTALTEMRRLLGLLREEGERPGLAPQPSIERLGELVAQIRDTGLRVELIIEGDSYPLPPGVDLSAYRIVQEALTNTLRHARAKHARVLVRYEPDRVAFEVVDDGRGNGASPRPGRGLLGMRERVALYGGGLDHGVRHGGGFRVAAWLPTNGADA